MTSLAPLLATIAAYLIGGIPFGYLLVKWKTGGDVRASGSGNIGATNVLRASGTLTGILTLLLDGAKGWVAVYLTARLSGGNIFWESAAALAVVAGHIFSPYLRFKGGKGVATFVGAFLYLAPVPLGAITLIFVAFVWYSRYISLGSIMGAITFPFGVWLILHPPAPLFLSALLSSGLVLYRHKGNIARLRNNTENVFRFSSRKA
jgi:acyl phosphate:glycerol-3-phosphate acyltransferase